MAAETFHQEVVVSRLNIDQLQAAVIEASGSPSSRDRDLSRRQVLGLAGATAIAGAPALRHLESAVTGRFTVRSGPGVVAFQSRGGSWVVDARRFGGSPHLTMRRSKDLIRVQLRGATYPGTGIPADFVAEVRNGASGWRLSLEMTFGRFRTKVPFEKWLRRRAAAEARIIIRGQTERLDQHIALRVQGRARTTFSPDWSLRLRGRQIGFLTGVGSEIISDDVTIRLVGREEPSSMRGVTHRGSVLSLHRGKQAWDLTLPEGPSGSTLESLDGGFDRIDIESRLIRAGGVGRVLVAQSERDGDALVFRPSSQLTGLDRKTFGIPLRHARYAVPLGIGSGAAALAAAFSSQPAWLSVEGCSVALGAGEATEPFLLRAGRHPNIRCAPDILGTATGLADAVVEPQPPRRATPLEFAWSKKRSRKAGVGSLALHPKGPHHDLIIPNYVVSILRPDDLLALRLEYQGFDLVVGGGNPPVLVRNASRAYVVAHFAPQNIAEQAFYDIEGGKSNETPTPPGTLQANIAGPSRLAFDIPAAVTTIAYTIDAVLDWSTFTQRVAPTALPPGATTKATISEPTPDQTDIEAPYRLHLSPSTYAFWNHVADPVPGPGGQVELWHTRLGVRGTHGQTHDDNDPTDANLRTVRAIWSDDYDSNNPFTAPPKFSTGVSYYNPYRSSLDADDRYQITRLTSDFTGKWYSNDQTGDYVPSPAGVNRLALSTLGAWMNVRGYWDPQLQDLDLLEWEHKATMARDHYVKVVLAGYLFPFGHKAALVKITERKFTRTLQATGAPGPIVAYLRQRMFILVREPVKTFKGPHDPGAPSPPDYPPADQTKADGAGNWKEGYEGRQMPFKSVQITTLVTPDIEDPGKTPASAIKPPSGFTTYSGFGATDAFWPLIPVNGKDVDFLWHLVGTDWDGNSVAFTCPLIFLSEIMSSYIPKQIQKPKPPVPAFSNYKNLTQWILPVYESAVYQGLASPAPAKATVQMHGAKIAIAPSAPSTNGQGTDPAVATNTVTFGAAIPPDTVVTEGPTLPLDQPQFYPTFVVADVEIPPIKHLLGKNAQTKVAVAKPYLDNGFDGNKNKGEVFMDLVKDASGVPQQLPLVFGKGDSGQVMTPGTVSPNLSIAGLSRSIGPVGAKIQNPGSPSASNDYSSVSQGLFDPDSFFGDNQGLLGNALPKLFGAVKLTDILSPLDDFTKQLNKIPGLHVTRTDTEIRVHFFWETEQIKPWEPGGQVSASAGSLNAAVFAPWVINDDGSNTLPQDASGNGIWQSGGNLIPPSTGAAANKDASPPPIPEVDDGGDPPSGTQGVDNSGNDPSHVWVATYINTSLPNPPTGSPNPQETVASLGALYDVSQGGIQTGPRAIKVTVQKSPHASGGMNIYRSKVGTAWPLYKIPNPKDSSKPTVEANHITGTGTYEFLDSTSDDGLDGNSTPSTWTQLGLDVLLTVPLNGDGPTYSITGEVAYASLQMDVIAVPFYSLTFVVRSGQKLTVKPAVGEVVFVGPLKFLNTLRKFLNAFSDPPYLDVTDTDITAGYTFGLPTITVGVLSLQNISVGAGINVPFFGDTLSVSFNFCTKEQPFMLTVYIFDGGGFFEIVIAPSGVIGLHIGFNFGAHFGLDIVIAKGQVSAQAGITYDYDQSTGTTLTAWLDLNGSVEVLGIISIGVDFNLTLKYTEDSNGSGLDGSAKLTVEIHLVFFTISPTLGPIHKHFAGSETNSQGGAHALPGNPPPSDNAVSIATMIQQDTWAAYTAAFAG
ncbi:MAG TPA: hypothetical protein VFB34_10515 [Chloroflexota bacterium]|nr:hypothetical protein [Chloroflexota bacterium]